jgi:predicted AAA+ superfamily ATPase
MLVKREMEKELKDLAKVYPVVTITGPRQSGKTTLTQMAFPNKPYCSMEDPDVLMLAEADPRSFLNEYPEGVIMDDVQRAPFLLSYIQGIVDKRKKPGLFILTGSRQFDLNAAVSQTLAGRTAILKLMPLTISESEIFGGFVDINDQLLKGFYPRTYEQKLDPTKMYASYFQTYVERDVRQLINIKDLSSFRRLLRILAGRVGGLVNLSGLCSDTGITAATLKSWLSVLEESYVIFFLEPYYENFGKRLIKSPKLYFHDVGLAAYLLGIENTVQMMRDPLRGALFENMVIADLQKKRFNAGLESNLFFFRDNKGNEVDVILREGAHLYPVEIKSSTTFNKDFLKGVSYFETIAGERVPESFVVFGGTTGRKIGNTKLVPYTKAGTIS